MTANDETAELFRRADEARQGWIRLERDAALAAIARVRALCTQWLESSGYYERWMGAAVLAALEPVVVVADPAGQPAPSEGATTTTVRTWQQGDPEPGPEVRAVGDCDDDLWWRCGSHWHFCGRRYGIPGEFLHERATATHGWNHILLFDPVVDATGEVTP